jgi:hypothetical protein
VCHSVDLWHRVAHEIPSLTLKEIGKKVLKRAPWIRKQQAFFDQFLPRTPPREYVSGETHNYLGKRYVLRVRRSKDEGVKLVGGNLLVTANRVSGRSRVKQLLSAWYKAHAMKKFEDSIVRNLKLFKSHKLGKPKLVVRRMPKRWGSCAASGTVLLNPEIIKAHSKCIDYVVIHELCHLVHPRHDRKFFHLQNRVMPDWERWKGRLERLLV